MRLVYAKGSTLPAAQIWWFQADNTLYNFSSGWTFAAKVGQPATTATTTVANGSFTGAVGSGDDIVGGSPNLLVNWSSGDLGALASGSYAVDLFATRTSDSRVLAGRFALVIVDTVL